MNEIYVFSYVDFVPYVILFLLLTICCVTEFFGCKKSVNIAFWVLFIFSAIRYDVGWDFMQYEMFITKGVNTPEFERFEWMNRFMFQFFHYIGIHQLYFIVTAFFTLYPVCKLAKIYSPYPALSLFLFTAIPLFYFPSLSTVRNSLAFSIVLLAIHYCITKQYIKYLLAVICSIGIHSSAYISLLIPVVVFFPQKRNICALMFILSFFASDLVLNLIMSLAFDNHALKRAQDYIEYFGSPQGDTLKYLIYIMCIISFLFWNKINTNRYDKILLNFVFLGSCMFFVFYFDGNMSQRFSVFFIQCFVFVLPKIIFNFKYNNRIVLSSMTMFFGILLSFYYLNQYVVGFLNGDLIKISYMPYKVFF